jgi:hypothetical protein
MTTERSVTETRRRSARLTWPFRPPSTTSPRAPFGPTLALTLTLAVAFFAVVMAVVMLRSTPTDLGSLGEQNQDAETALYVIAFALILPVALIVVPRLAGAVAAGPNTGALSLLAALLVATLAASILVASLLPGGGGLVGELIVVGIWWVGAVAALARARQTRPWSRLLEFAHLAQSAWALAGALVLAALLAFTSLESLSPVPVLGAVVAAIALLAAARRGAAGLPRVPRRWGLAIDAAITVLILLAIPDLIIFNPGQALDTFIVQFHHDLWLGPANELLAGRALLVDNASQYGIGPIYLLAAWFQLAPIGYGTFGFLDGVLFAFVFGGSYSVLRLAGVSRFLAAGALALGIIALIYNLEYSVGTLPQHGPLRFGLPIILILAAVAEARFPRRSRACRVAQLVTLGLASVWALEAFAYTIATFAGIVGFQAWMRPGPGRLGWLAGEGALALGACAGAHLVFNAVTLAFAGQLPDYGQYLDFLDEFLFGAQSSITFDFSHWSAGLPVGMAYAASAVALVLLVRCRRDIVERERTAVIALCGTTAYGIVLFSYFVNRSGDLVLPYVALPALLAGTLWLSLLLRGALVESRSVRVGGLAFALSLSALLLSVAWSSIGDRFPRSALAHVVPGGEPLGGAVDRLWSPPPLDLRAPQGELLIDEYMPSQRRVVILALPALATEILMRSGRANKLAFTDPVEDGFLGSKRIPAIRRSVAELEPGERLLMQDAGLTVLAALDREPSRDAFANPVSFPESAGESLLPLQQWALQRIRARFGIRVIHRDEQGYVVAELTARR